jgi:hypothetical protein
VSATPIGALVVLLGLVLSVRGVVVAQVFLCLLAATTAAGLPGGAVLTPGVLFSPFFVARSWRYRPLGGHRVSRPTFTLLCLTLWIVVGAFILPRAFERDVMVYALDRARGGITLQPLVPSSGNFTQPTYAVGQFAVFCAARAFFARAMFSEAFLRAGVALAAANAFAAMLGLVCFHAGIPDPLAGLRDAYAVFATYDVGGMVRIQGTFSETSGFSSFTLGLFAFTTSLWFQRAGGRYVGLLSLVLLALLLLSTSTTAYVALFLLGSIVLVDTALGTLRRRVPKRVATLVILGLCIAALFVSVVSFELEIGHRVAVFLESSVFGKMESSSGLERTSWNRQAWQCFLSSYGLGVGTGSTRSSSLLFVLLSNAGLPGTLLFVIFIGYCVRGTRSLQPGARAAAYAIVGWLCSAALISGVYDLGLAFYVFAAAATTSREPRRALAADLPAAPPADLPMNRHA